MAGHLRILKRHATIVCPDSSKILLFTVQFGDERVVYDLIFCASEKNRLPFYECHSHPATLDMHNLGNKNRAGKLVFISARNYTMVVFIKKPVRAANRAVRRKRNAKNTQYACATT
jgi:hypothetical protein